MVRSVFAFPVVALLLGGATAAQTNPVQLSIGEVDTVAGTIDFYMANTTPVYGFQFNLTDQAGAPVALISGSGGTAGTAGFTVYGSPAGVALGFSFSGTSIPSSGGAHQLLTTYEYTGSLSAVCMSQIVISGQAGTALGCDGGPCVKAPPVDCNGNGIDDATDIFQGSSVDLDGDGAPDECLLSASPPTISLASGGVQKFNLSAGPAQAAQLYLLLGSLSGTAPGTPVGGHVLPLNLDNYLLFSLQNANVAPFATTFTFLGLGGDGSASLTIPAGAPPALAGFTAHHAYVVFDTATLSPTLTSNSVALSLIP